MDGRQALIRGIELTIVTMVVLLLVGQVIGQPVLLSFVQTGSMEPALRPGDGFVAIPAAVAGPVEEGDVIVFDADQLNGGGLVTHRVVDLTDDGRYITKGDANPFTDQDGREPPVQDAQVVAKALQVGGDVVVIPYLGAVVIAAQDTLSGLQTTLARTFRTRALLGTQGLAYLLFAVGLLAYFASLLADSSASTRRRRRTDREADVMDAKVVIVSLALLLVLVTSASMVFSGGTHEFEVISSSSDAPGHRVIPRGTSETVEFSVPSNGVLPVVVFLEPGGEGIEVEPTELAVASNGKETATITLSAPQQTGRYVYFLTERRYLAVLPTDTIRALYGVHPWLPILAIDALFAVGFSGLAAALIGTGKIRMRPPRRSWWSRVQQWFR